MHRQKSLKPKPTMADRNKLHVHLQSAFFSDCFFLEGFEMTWKGKNTYNAINKNTDKHFSTNNYFSQYAMYRCKIFL